MSKYYRVYADVYLDCIRDNVDALMAQIEPGTKAMAVVKADGYGHGDVAVAKAVYDKVFGYAVATLDEAVNLRQNGIDKPILILGFVNTDEYETLVNNEVAATVFDYETARELDIVAKRLGKKALCHIKVDTGMRRIGLEPDESGKGIVRNIKQLGNVDAVGIFTHFATADELDKCCATKQLEKFDTFVKGLEEEGIVFQYKHCANSAATIDMPYVCKDMVRLGIAMYGMYPSGEVSRDKVKLTPALELKSHITMVKVVKEGEPVSYGGTFITKRDTKIATVSVGYGDGYPRALSSKGYVLVDGKKAPIIGRVCMDQLMIDVTEIPDVKRNDVVTLIGKDKDEVITVEEISELAGTFNYEFVCDLNKRIPRNYYMEGRYIGSHDYFRDKWELDN
ncbi:MAG: alanine racemase [Lachnospira sp.]|nr:alanine racemase [Lachnospira sp.]